ncbi:hypothetical protein HDK90DRAFT_555860, partial [Phyllosticta capitalensis]
MLSEPSNGLVQCEVWSEVWKVGIQGAFVLLRLKDGSKCVCSRQELVLPDDVILRIRRLHAFAGAVAVILVIDPALGRGVLVLVLGEVARNGIGETSNVGEIADGYDCSPYERIKHLREDALEPRRVLLRQLAEERSQIHGHGCRLCQRRALDQRLHGSNHDISQVVGVDVGFVEEGLPVLGHGGKFQRRGFHRADRVPHRLERHGLDAALFLSLQILALDFLYRVSHGGKAGRSSPPGSSLARHRFPVVVAAEVALWSVAVAAMATSAALTGALSSLEVPSDKSCLVASLDIFSTHVRRRMDLEAPGAGWSAGGDPVAHHLCVGGLPAVPGGEAHAQRQARVADGNGIAVNSGVLKAKVLVDAALVAVVVWKMDSAAIDGEEARLTGAKMERGH